MQASVVSLPKNEQETDWLNQLLGALKIKYRAVSPEDRGEIGLIFAIKKSRKNSGTLQPISTIPCAS